MSLPEGCTLLELLPPSLLRCAAVNSLARKSKALKEGDPNLAGDYIREGLGAVVSVKVRCSKVWPCLLLPRWRRLHPGGAGGAADIGQVR